MSDDATQEYLFFFCLEFNKQMSLFTKESEIKLQPSF